MVGGSGVCDVGEHVAEAVEAGAPDGFEPFEHGERLADGVDVPVHELLAPVALLGDEAGPFEHGHVLLHGGEAHRVAAGERRHGVFLPHGDDRDVAPGGVGQCVEDRIRRASRIIYNHMVVGSRIRDRLSSAQHLPCGCVFTRPDDLTDDEVADALRARWRIDVETIEWLAVGFGSHHWDVHDRNGRRWFATADETTGDGRLIAALETAAALRGAGLEFVVAPVATVAGPVAVPIATRYALALYPHVPGEGHAWGPYPDDAARDAVLDRVVAVHAATPVAGHLARLDDLAIPSRDRLVELLGGDVSWGPGPYAEPAQRALAARAGRVRSMLNGYADLVRSVVPTRERWVVTHGEPHQANTIDTDDGVVLVDWETALLAPPERDLWSIAQEQPSIVDLYTERTGVPVDADALALYRLRWTLTDIALYVDTFSRPHADTADIRVAWGALSEHLA